MIGRNGGDPSTSCILIVLVALAAIALAVVLSTSDPETLSALEQAIQASGQ